jgi:tetratricopeptide (TPR) repeat protein
MAVAMLTAQKEVSQGSYREQIGIGPFLIQRSDNNDNLEGIYFEFTGVNAGFLAYGIGSLTGGNGVIIMLNSGDDVNGLGKEIRRSVAKVYGWTNFLPDEIQPVSLSNNELQNFVGRYRMGPDEVLYLRQEKNYLVEKINEGNDIYCFPIAKDTIVFSDYNVKGWFQFDGKGNAVSLQNFYQQKPMPKMKKDEFSPSEYLKFKNYAQAKEGYRGMEMNEYRMTYLAYDLMNKKPLDLEAVRTILDLALEQHPNSSIVYSRWGDFFLLKDDIPNAVINYKKALELDPTDEQTLEVLKNLLK